MRAYRPQGRKVPCVVYHSIPMIRESSNPPAPQDKNISDVGAMEVRGLHDRSRGEHISDAISGLASTPAFALAHVYFFAGWLVTQTGMVPLVPIFDPFPFTFLTLVVSLEAIFLSLFVLISQTRMTRQTDLLSHLDLQVNLLTEQESTKTLKLLYAIAKHLEIPDLPSDQTLSADTSVQGLIEDIGSIPVASLRHQRRLRLVRHRRRRP